MHSAFSNFLKTQEWDNHSVSLGETTAQQVENALNQEGRGGLANLKALLSPVAGEKYIEEMAKLSFSLTRKRFGKAVRLFAPMNVQISVIIAGLACIIKFQEKPLPMQKF
jgi:2-iminoacetate synthase